MSAQEGPVQLASLVVIVRSVQNLHQGHAVGKNLLRAWLDELARGALGVSSRSLVPAAV